MGGTSERPRGIRVRTSCATEDEFVAAFQTHCDPTSVFTPTEKMPAVGAECAFSFDLAGGQPVLRGLGVVLNAWSTADNPFAAPGVHIGCIQLTSQSEPVFGRILVARATAQARSENELEARTRSGPATQLLWGGTATPLNEEPVSEDSVLVETRRTITRERAAMVEATSGAPVAPIDERSTETVRHERPLRPPAPPVELLAPARSSRPPLPGMRAAAAPSVPPVLAPSPGFAIAAPRPAARARFAAWRAAIATRVEPRLLPVRRWLAAKATRLGPARAWLATRAARLSPVRRRLAVRWAPVAARVRPWLAAVGVWLAAVVARLSALAARLAAATAREFRGDRSASDAKPAAIHPPLWWRNPRVAAVFALGITLGVVVSLALRPSRAQTTKASPVAAITGEQCRPESSAMAALVERESSAAAIPARPVGAKPSGPRGEAATAPPAPASRPQHAAVATSSVKRTTAPAVTSKARVSAPVKPVAVASGRATRPSAGPVAIQPALAANKPVRAGASTAKVATAPSAPKVVTSPSVPKVATAPSAPKVATAPSAPKVATALSAPRPAAAKPAAAKPAAAKPAAAKPAVAKPPSTAKRSASRSKEPRCTSLACL